LVAAISNDFFAFMTSSGSYLQNKNRFGSIQIIGSLGNILTGKFQGIKFARTDGE
jgi:hypothetical protein